MLTNDLNDTYLSTATLENKTVQVQSKQLWISQQKMIL